MIHDLADVDTSYEGIQDLLENSRFLECLMKAGIETWEGYNEAVALFDAEDYND